MSMTLDPKALGAAKAHAEEYSIEISPEEIANIITAYLSALTTGDVGELVERLQVRLRRTGLYQDAELADEAASLIQSQAARIAALEAGLGPFNAVAKAVFRDGMNSCKADTDGVWGFDNSRMTYGHLRSVRDLLTGEGKG